MGNKNNSFITQQSSLDRKQRVSEAPYAIRHMESKKFYHKNKDGKAKLSDYPHQRYSTMGYAKSAIVKLEIKGVDMSMMEVIPPEEYMDRKICVFKDLIVAGGSVYDTITAVAPVYVYNIQEYPEKSRRQLCDSFEEGYSVAYEQVSYSRPKTKQGLRNKKKAKLTLLFLSGRYMFKRLRYAMRGGLPTKKLLNAVEGEGVFVMEVA